MERFCEELFDWNRIEQRYGLAQGVANREEYNFHLAIVEIYFKYFRGIRIRSHLPFRLRKYLMRGLLIAFVQRCFLVTYPRYYDFERSREDMLSRFELYRQFLPRLFPFSWYHF